MGLEASKRMAELSAEYMSQVDKLKKEKETARERAEAAEEEAKMLAEMMRANGFATPPGAGLLERATAGANASTATTSTPIAGPAALAFASPVVYDQSLDCLMTPTGDFVFPGSGDSGNMSGLDLVGRGGCHQIRRRDPRRAPGVLILFLRLRPATRLRGRRWWPWRAWTTPR